MTSLERELAKPELALNLFDPIAELVQKRWRKLSFWVFFKSAFSCAQSVFLSEEFSSASSSSSAASILTLLTDELFARCKSELESDSGWEFAHEPRKNTKVFFKVCEHRRSLFVRSVSLVSLSPAKIYEVLRLQLGRGRGRQGTERKAKKEQGSERKEGRIGKRSEGGGK